MVAGNLPHHLCIQVLLHPVVGSSFQCTYVIDRCTSPSCSTHDYKTSTCIFILVPRIFCRSYCPIILAALSLSMYAFFVASCLCFFCKLHMLLSMTPTTEKLPIVYMVLTTIRQGYDMIALCYNQICQVFPAVFVIRRLL